jgi:hypothetical protein
MGEGDGGKNARGLSLVARREKNRGHACALPVIECVYRVEPGVSPIFKTPDFLPDLFGVRKNWGARRVDF